MKYAKINYQIDIGKNFGVNIDEFIEFANRARTARDSIRENYPSQIDCSVITTNANSLSVILEEVQNGHDESQKNLVVREGALREYISMMGLPKMIEFGSDWDVCNAVLAEKGYRTRWSFAGGGIGKWVEPMKKIRG